MVPNFVYTRLPQLKLTLRLFQLSVRFLQIRFLDFCKRHARATGKYLTGGRLCHASFVSFAIRMSRHISQDLSSVGTGGSGREGGGGPNNEGSSVFPPRRLLWR